LSGRVAIVTGSGRNIGKAIALRLAQEGAALVVNARTNRDEADAVVAEIAQMGGQAVCCIADITSEDDVARLIATAVEQFGRLDILVNNAAVRHESPLNETSLADWRRVTGIILDGAFLCARAAAPHLGVHGHGAIVNIGGMTGASGAPGRTHVVTGKAGLEGLTKALAWDLAEAGVTVNLVHPGMVDTPRDHAGAPARPAHHKVHRPLLGRRGQPEEIASVVAMLCGDDGRFMTGQIVHVNGGTYLP
jgi:3-oxoacyl-[acyl-carrier protein] reductase